MTSHRRKIKKIALIYVLMVLAIVFYIAGHLGFNYLTKNVHVVIPDKIYRAAQLNQQEWETYTQKYHFKTIINLRGPWPSNSWYRIEKNFAKKNHIHYYSIYFLAYELPNKNNLRKLVHVLLTAPKPLVFHCEGGADRTGMAAAISVILFDKHATIAQIKYQDSWHYNAISRKTIGYQVLRNYFAWLKQHHDTLSKNSFLKWLNSSAQMKPYYGWFLT